MPGKEQQPSRIAHRHKFPRINGLVTATIDGIKSDFLGFYGKSDVTPATPKIESRDARRGSATAASV
jgi:hypothetical protein